MTHGLTIEEWAFWSPEGDTPAAWREHWRQPGAEAVGTEFIAAAIPAADRRRMSALSKLAVQTAIEASRSGPADFLVFCSQHGELARTHELLRDIVAGIELSPTAFSQSVHNTSAGLYSIITQNRAPATSIAAGPSSFAYGWLEAETQLLENPRARALLVCYDDAVPQEYRPFIAEQIQCRYAVALTLRLANGAGIVLESPDVDDTGDSLPLAPSFLAWWLSAAKSYSVTAGDQHWRWRRNAG